MALPNLPAEYESQALEVLTRTLPGQWFQSICTAQPRIYPLMRGMALAIAHARYSLEQSLNAAIPATSEGAWLSLHLQSIGLNRRSGETDAQALVRYQQEFSQNKLTHAGLQRAIEALTGLQSPQVRLETDHGAGRYGQFRVVIDAQSLPWDEVDIGFLGEFIRNFVAAGITPSLAANLQCLLYQQFGYWRFSDAFPPHNLSGPAWQRRRFISAASIATSRNLVAQVNLDEWRAKRDELETLYQQGRQDAPGEFFVYLADPGECPYLLADYLIDLASADISAFDDRTPIIDGFRFSHQLPGYATVAGTLIIAPNTLTPVPPLGGLIPTYPTINLPPLVLPESITQADRRTALVYQGISFTRWQVQDFVEGSGTTTPIVSPGLELARTGPWELVITEGLPEWGQSPPGGTTLTGTPIGGAPIKGRWWWVDLDGNPQDQPVWDATAREFNLAVEFILPKSSDRTIRELELRLNGQRVQYRRVAMAINEETNFGALFLVTVRPNEAAQALLLGGNDLLLNLGATDQFLLI
jgi:hypothetical protein